MTSVDNSISPADELVAPLDAVLSEDDKNNNSSSSVVSHGSIETQNVDSSNPGETIDQRNSCSHPSVSKLMCTSCGQRLDDNYGLPFGYLTEGLRLSKAEADKLRDLKTANLLSNKKLILVLDLDETLISSSQISDLTPDEKYLTDLIPCGFNGNLFKLRPFVPKFLQEASTMFEMYVYTLAGQVYARQAIKLVDPENKYFGSRIITRDDNASWKRKSLDVVLGRETEIVILDDRRDVWPMHNANLIQVNEYKYFANSRPRVPRKKARSLAEKNCDEKQYIMASYLHLLKLIHNKFFEDPKDVREVIREVRLEILKGVKVCLREFPKEKCNKLEEMAKRMGAVCGNELDSSVTHVVTKNAGEEEHVWACNDDNNDDRYLVGPGWLRYCYKLWHRIPEMYYSKNKKD